MAVKFTNNAATTLAAGINSSVTSIAVTDGSIFPALSGGDHFYVTFDDTTNREIVKVTARSGNTLTVVRGQDNTTAQAFNSGDKAELRVVAALLEDVKTEVTSTFTVDTFTGDDTTTAFTLSQAPSSEDNLIVFIEGAYQNPSDFVLSGTTLTFDEAPLVDRNIIVYHVKGAVSGNNLNQDSFTADGNTAAFTLSIDPIHENNTQVFIDGVYQQKNSYSISGTTLTLDANPSNGATVEVMTFTQTDVNTLPASFVSGLTEVTAVGADHFMIFDATDSALKKSLVSDVLESATSISTSADATAITIDSSENVTFTNNVTINSGQLTAGGLAYPTSDGTNGQVLTTDGAGTLSFTTIDTSISANSVGITELNVSDGTNGQALVTDGAGTLSFSTISSGATDINGLSDAKTFGTSSIMLGSATTGTINAANYNTGLGVGVFNALTEGDENVMIGFAAGQTLNTGSHNIGIGVNAVDDCSTGSYNVGIGTAALGANTTGYFQTAIGYEALRNTDYTTNVYAYNTAVGYQAGVANTTGKITAIGARVLASNTTGIMNVGVGGATDATGAALEANTTGNYNTAVGKAALRNNDTGYLNTAHGYLALSANTTGLQNTAIGASALQANTTASNNVAVGKEALAANTTGTNNSGVGTYALFRNTTGNNNTAIGRSALVQNTTGTSNTGLGIQALDGVTTGGDNVGIGYESGGYGTGTVTTGSGNTYVGAYARAGGGAVAGEIGIGRFCLSQGSSTATLGYNGTGVHIAMNGSTTSWSAHSDERLKENIIESTAGLSFINDLRPITYNWKSKKDISDEFENYYDADSDEPVQGQVKQTNHGFIAQEVKAAIDAHPEIKEGHSIWRESPDGIQNLANGALIPMMVKAIQELSAQVKELESRLGD
jgi:hypothetical protein